MSTAGIVESGRHFVDHGGLVIVGAGTYVLSWLLPAAVSNRIFDSGKDRVSASTAFQMALASAWESSESVSALYGKILSSASALTNFILVGALLDAWVNALHPHRFVRVILLACAVLNTKWVLNVGFRDLRTGYYLWVSAFFLTAAGLFLNR